MWSDPILLSPWCARRYGQLHAENAALRTRVAAVVTPLKRERDSLLQQNFKFRRTLEAMADDAGEAATEDAFDGYAAPARLVMYSQGIGT